jgi:hypothetical protein
LAGGVIGQQKRSKSPSTQDKYTVEHVVGMAPLIEIGVQSQETTPVVWTNATKKH